jgi:PAS domain S-box-containing protein
MTTGLVGRDAADVEHSLFSQLFLASPHATAVISVDGRISAANPAVIRLFGYPEPELIGNPIEMLMPERFRIDSLSGDRVRACLIAPRRSRQNITNIWA